MKKILILSDDEKIQDLSKSWAGKFGCGICERFNQAIELLQNEKYDVVIVEKELENREQFREFVIKLRVDFPDMQLIVLNEKEKLIDRIWLYHWMTFDVFSKKDCRKKDIEGAILKPKQYFEVAKLMKYSPMFGDYNEEIYLWMMNNFFYLIENENFVDLNDHNGLLRFYFKLKEYEYDIVFYFPYKNDPRGEKFKVKVTTKTKTFFGIRTAKVKEEDYPEILKELIKITEKKYRNERRIRGFFQ